MSTTLRLAIAAPQPIASRAAYALGVLARSLGVTVERDAPLVLEWPAAELPLHEEDWRETADPPPGRDPLARAFWFLARVEEQLPGAARDEHGRFPWAASFASRAGIDPLAAPVDEIRGLVRTWLEHAGVEVPSSPWPDGHAFALAASHDIDGLARFGRGRASGVRGALGLVRRRRLGDAGRTLRALAADVAGQRDPWWTFGEMAAIERRHGARSTSFFLVDHVAPEDGPPPRTPDALTDAIAEVVAEGHEVGLHPSYTSALLPSRLLDEQAELAAVSGLAPATVVRHHYLRLKPDGGLAALAGHGFAVDSSLGFAERPGFRSGFSFPHRVYDLEAERVLPLVEVPLVLMDATLDRAHYLGLSAAEAARQARAVVEALAWSGGGASILWHNDRFDRFQPPAMTDLYDELLGLAKARGGWLASVGDLGARFS
jgi:hypothetical protein